MKKILFIAASLLCLLAVSCREDRITPDSPDTPGTQPVVPVEEDDPYAFTVAVTATPGYKGLFELKKAPSVTVSITSGTHTDYEFSYSVDGTPVGGPAIPIRIGSPKTVSLDVSNELGQHAFSATFSRIDGRGKSQVLDTTVRVIVAAMERIEDIRFTSAEFEGYYASGPVFGLPARDSGVLSFRVVPADAVLAKLSLRGDALTAPEKRMAISEDGTVRVPYVVNSAGEVFIRCDNSERVDSVSLDIALFPVVCIEPVSVDVSLELLTATDSGKTSVGGTVHTTFTEHAHVACIPETTELVVETHTMLTSSSPSGLWGLIPYEAVLSPELGLDVVAGVYSPEDMFYITSGPDPFDPDEPLDPENPFKPYEPAPRQAKVVSLGAGWYPAWMDYQYIYIGTTLLGPEGAEGNRVPCFWKYPPLTAFTFPAGGDQDLNISWTSKEVKWYMQTDDSSDLMKLFQEGEDLSQWIIR